MKRWAGFYNMRYQPGEPDASRQALTCLCPYRREPRSGRHAVRPRDRHSYSKFVPQDHCWDPVIIQLAFANGRRAIYHRTGWLRRPASGPDMRVSYPSTYRISCQGGKDCARTHLLDTYRTLRQFMCCQTRMLKASEGNGQRSHSNKAMPDRLS